jgi:NAD(P)-dependent dehydrogenase (short-subunit alcohol dehydrogenase family)
MSGRLDGRTALVTGSTSGLGRAMAGALAAEGAHVVLTGRGTAAGEAAVAELRAAGGRADFAAADLADGPPASSRLADDAERLLGGRVDILVNNAGIVPVGPTEDFDEQTYDRAWTVNVKSAFFLTGRLAPAMARRRSGHQHRVDRRLARHRRLGPVQRNQGGDRVADHVVGGGVRAARGTRQRHRPGTRGHRGHRCRTGPDRGHGLRLTGRPVRPRRGDRPARGLPRE